MDDLLIHINDDVQDLGPIFETTTGGLISSTTQVINNTSNFSHSRQYFKWYDYIIFVVVLTVTVAMGIYHRSKKFNKLMGSRNLGVWPLTVSLIARHTSGFTFIGLPADIYQMGIHYILSIVSQILVGIFVSYGVMPVFHRLEIGNTYEYLERRFDRRCRTCGSVIFFISVLLFLPVAVFTATLTIQTVTGGNYYAILVILCSICSFYTASGGFHVVWTDILGFTLTISTILATLIIGIRHNGIGIARNSDRLKISFNLDFTERETFWAIVIGLTIHDIGEFGFNPANAPKWLAAKTFSVFAYVVAMGVTNVIIILVGLVMFARYNGCDPLTSKQLDRQDQILPFFIMDISEEIPGVGALFIAGIFCLQLSVLSAACRTLYGYFMNWLERNDKICQRLTSTIVGIFVLGMIFIIQKMGGVFSMYLSFMSISYGPLLAMFALGLLFPDANSTGAFWGTTVAFVMGAVITVGNGYYKYIGLIKPSIKPLSVNETVTLESNQSLFVFRLAFYWYSALTATLGICFGLVISYLTGKNKHPVDDKLLIIQSWCKKIQYGHLSTSNEVELSETFYERERAHDIDFVEQ